MDSTPRPPILAGAVLVACAIFQFWRIDRAAYLYDEYLYSRMGWEYVHWGRNPDVAAISGAGNWEHPPLGKLIFGVAELLVSHGPSVTATRSASAVITVLAAIGLGLWGSRMLGGSWGLILLGGLACVPTPVTPQVTSLSRAGMLDSVAAGFVVMSIVCCAVWLTSSSTSRAWIASGGAGLFAGLAAASKTNGFLAVIGAVLVILAVRRSAVDVARAVVSTLSCVLSLSPAICHLVMSVSVFLSW